MSNLNLTLISKSEPINKILRKAEKDIENITNVKLKIEIKELSSFWIIDKICQLASEATGIEVRHIIGKSRNAEYVAVRQVVCYICYNDIGGITFKDLSLYFNNDHSTIIHSVNKVEDFLSINDDKTLNIYRRIKEQIF